MTDGTGWPELNEQLERIVARDERNRRVVLALTAVVVSAVIMVIGIAITGGAETVHYGSDYAYSYWSTPQFEIGVFMTLIGTVLLALSANFLTKSWRLS